MRDWRKRVVIIIVVVVKVIIIITTTIVFVIVVVIIESKSIFIVEKAVQIGLSIKKRNHTSQQKEQQNKIPMRH
jgi:hypothetical protein